MNIVAAKIPSVFHRNVDAEGKKKRGEHERSFNNKEKNPGCTPPPQLHPLNPPTTPPQMTYQPHPTQNPDPSASPPETPPPKAPPLYPNPDPITPPPKIPTPLDPPPLPNPGPSTPPPKIPTPNPTPLTALPPKKKQKKKKIHTLAWGRLSPLSQWPLWCGKLGSGNQPASWWPPWCGSQERGGREATPLFQMTTRNEQGTRQPNRHNPKCRTRPDGGHVSV